MQSCLHRVGLFCDKARTKQRACGDFHDLIRLRIGAGFSELTLIRGLLLAACRLAEITDVGLVVVNGIAGLVVVRFRLVVSARTEYGKRNVLALVGLDVVEDAGAFPEDLLEGRRACLHTPAGVVAQDALDERLIRRCSRTRMEREGSTRHAATVIRSTVVVVLPIAPRTVRIPSGVVRALVVARARLTSIQPTRARAFHALALRREVAAASLVRSADLTARRVDLAVFIDFGVH